MIGYKVLNPDWTCINYKFELGKTHIHEGEIIMCKSGFHFCTNLIDCFNYYSFIPNNIVCEIKAEEVYTSNDKSHEQEDSKKVCRKITLIRQLNWHEVLELCNSGKNNTGYKNSGNRNSGNCNSGIYNSGIYNSGSYNSGHYNSGNHNSGEDNSGNYNSGNLNYGSCNSGDWNYGHFNSGSCNSGNFNSGSFNSTNCSSGFFNDSATPIYMFGKIVDLERLQLSVIIDKIKNNISKFDPDYKTNWIKNWENWSDEQKQLILNLPNFCPKVFENITGIKV